MGRMEHVRALRASTDPRYNCCQSILVPFAGEMGLTEEAAAELLKASHERGVPRKALCDGPVFQMTELLDRLLIQNR